MPTFPHGASSGCCIPSVAPTPSGRRFYRPDPLLLASSRHSADSASACRRLLALSQSLKRVGVAFSRVFRLKSEISARHFMCHSAKLSVWRDTVRSPVRIYPGARLTHALPSMANVSVTGGFSPSHEAAHVLPKCPSYKEETYAKTGEPNVTRPLLRQGADTPLGNRTERVGPRAE